MRWTCPCPRIGNLYGSSHCDDRRQVCCLAGESAPAGQLGPDGIAFSGYRDRKSEVDPHVLGSGGLLGIEIKHVGGVIHGHGDTWTRDKIDPMAT